MIYQTNPGLNTDYEKVGCAFDCVAYAREKFTDYQWTVDQLNAAWDGSHEAGILGKDHVIQDWGQLARFLGAPIFFEGRFDTLPDDLTGKFVVTAWYNNRTKFTHFVVGHEKPVEFDPIEGGSVTVREGYPQSHRVFRILA